MSERSITFKLREDIAKNIPNVKLFRNHVGLIRDMRGTYHKAGLGKGSSDLIGLISPSGRFIAVEVKTPVELERVIRMLAGELKLAKHIESQLQFLNCIKRNGGVACFAATWHDVKRAIDEQ